MFRLGDAVSQMGDKFFVIIALLIFVSIFAGVLLYTIFLNKDSADTYASLPLGKEKGIAPSTEAVLPANES